MNRVIVNIILFTLFVWSISTMQYLLSSALSNNSSSIYGYTSIICLISLEFISFFLIISNLKNLLVSRIAPILLIWLLYVIFNTMMNSSSIMKDIREVIWWPLMYCTFYTIGSNGNNKVYLNKITNFFFYLGTLLAILFIYSRSMSLFVISLSGKEIYVASNLIFFIGLILPFAFLNKNILRKYFILVSGIITIFISFKRSAIIFGLIVFFIAIYFDFFKKKRLNLLKRLFIVGLSILGVIYSYNYLDKSTNGYISSRFISMENDKGSGRLTVYSYVWNSFLEKPFIYQLVGSGHNSVLKEGLATEDKNGVRLSAHNDILEVLFDFGYIGLVIYLIFIYKAIILTKESKSVDIKIYQANIATLCIFLIMTSVSHLILYPTYYAYLIIVWAITDGQSRNNKSKIIYAQEKQH